MLVCELTPRAKLPYFVHRELHRPPRFGSTAKWISISTSLWGKRRLKAAMHQARLHGFFRSSNLLRYNQSETRPTSPLFAI